MKLLIMVLNKTELLEDVLEGLSLAGIKGATVIDSQGMARVLGSHSSERLPFFGSLSMLINENRPFNKTIFIVLEEKQIKNAIQAIKFVVGDLSQPDAGVLFTVPVNFVEGLQK